jgi:putative addiction module killer protein
MVEVTKTDEFDDWLQGLEDRKAKAKILVRIQRLEAGNPGQVNSVGDGVSEMKIDFGPGYRVYYKQIGKDIALILCGGDKSTQDKDIKRAKALLGELEGRRRWRGPQNSTPPIISTIRR